MALTISTVSLVTAIGASKLTPCQPSITCGPLVPMPSRNRPPESSCNDIADIASMAGLRAPSWAIADPSAMRSVCPARKASGVSASWPHASATQTDVAPRRSASRTKSTSCGPATWVAIPTCMRLTPSLPSAYHPMVEHAELRYADCPTTEAELMIDAPPAVVWPLVCVIGVPAEFSSEFQGGQWLDGATGPALGARFRGRNYHEAAG